MLKFQWNIMEQPACCGNCIFKKDIGDFFSCNKGVDIKDNHFKYQNSITCSNHSFSKNKKFIGNRKKFKSKK